MPSVVPEAVRSGGHVCTGASGRDHTAITAVEYGINQFLRFSCYGDRDDAFVGCWYRSAGINRSFTDH